MNEWFVSSSGAGLSATIGGFSIVGIAQVIEFALKASGHPVPTGSVGDLLVQIVQAVGMLYSLFGAGRKLFYYISNKTA